MSTPYFVMKAVNESMDEKKEAPKPSSVKKKPSKPVTNPAFRDSAALRDLQRQLHRNERKK